MEALTIVQLSYKVTSTRESTMKNSRASRDSTKLKIQLLDSDVLMLVLDVNVDAVIESLNRKTITKLQCIN